jgi:hypothetical protein
MSLQVGITYHMQCYHYYSRPSSSSARAFIYNYMPSSILLICLSTHALPSDTATSTSHCMTYHAAHAAFDHARTYPIIKPARQIMWDGLGLRCKRL